jgi:hypothetical protein
MPARDSEPSMLLQQPDRMGPLRLKIRITAFAMPLTNTAFPPVEKQIGNMWFFSNLMLMS